MKLWLDDVRDPVDWCDNPGEWFWAKTARQAIDFIDANHESIEKMSLDHDLGECAGCTQCDRWCSCECHWNGYTVCKHLAETGRWPKTKPFVHSANPVGAANMRAVIDRYFTKKE